MLGAGCVAHSALFWMATLHPKAQAIIKGLYVISYILWALALMLDRSVMSAFNLRSSFHYGLLIWYAITTIIGVGISWVLMA